MNKFRLSIIGDIEAPMAKKYDCDYCRNNIHEVKAAYPTSFIDTP